MRIKCSLCEDTQEKNYFEENAYYANILKKMICDQCYESNLEHSSSIVKFGNHMKRTVKFNEYFAMDDRDGGAPPEWFTKYFIKREYHNTDGWRGHYESKWAPELITLCEGWVTGWASESDHAHKIPAVNLMSFMEGEGRNTPVPIFWLFEPTSNLFSTASEILVDRADEKQAIGYLAKNGFEIKSLEEAFS